MAENILDGILHDEISPDSVIKWISKDNQQCEQSVDFKKFTCTTGDFISHFLNYIHEDAPSFDIENVNKNTFTPKSIKNADKNKPDSKLTIKKRPALFPDTKTELRVSHSQTFPLIPVKNSNEVSKHIVNNDLKSNGMSTPKLMKINSDTVLETSYASPISPLYSRDNFNTPKNRSTVKNSEKSLCLGDFIVQKKSSSKKKAQRNLCGVMNAKNNDNIENKKFRRINPTNLNEKRFNGGFKESENSFNFKNAYVELSVDNLNEQRNLLVEERLKIKSNIDDLIKSPNLVKLQAINNKTEINPVPEKVTFISQLDNLLKIYVFFLNKGYVLNIASELYFLISLLLSKQYLSDKFDDSDTDIQMIIENIENRKDLFKTVHNCVYFSVNALQSQTELLKSLDRPTLKLLYEDERIKLFSECFYIDLTSIYNNKLDQTKENIDVIQGNVCFISDTDNRDNFPTDTSFHAFRKQRDLFYEILRIWEQNHFLPEWNFSIALGGKIKSLLNIHGDPVNFRHFARLFKMQLLTTSRQNNDDETINEQASILASLPNIDAEKLHRLKARLITKQENNALNSTPTFTGHQEFYKDFILASGSHIFYEHLKNAIILEINQLSTSNNFNDFLENEENDFSVDSLMRNSYFTTLKFLRILAKFLAFIETLSYKMDSKMVSEGILKAEIDTRRWYQPHFDLKQIVLRSIKENTLILTIPWIVKYISMLDYVTVRLPYFENILEILFYIYHTISTQSEPNFSSNPNKIIIKFCLGWLFELPHFPSESYYNWLSNTSSKDISRGSNSNWNLSGKTDSNPGKNKLTPSLDDLEIVDQTILYTFCPYLEGFRKLLATNSLNSGNVVKHITPLSAVENSIDVTEKKLKCQLEEAFFNCQPVSVRKTVEFVSERVASSCVKHICNNVVPEFKKTSLEDARSVLLQLVNNYEDLGEESDRIENQIKNKLTDLTPRYLKQLQELCSRVTKNITSERISRSIEALLAIDELPQTKETCCMITKRLCLERVQQWVNSHINIGLFNKFKSLHGDILKTLDTPEKEKDVCKPVFQLPSGGQDVAHNPDALSSVKIVEIAKNLCLSILEKKSIQDNYIADFLQSTERTISERCDVNGQILSLINKLLMDMVLLLLTHRLEYFDQFLPQFINHWKNFNKPNEDLFKTLICPRNVMLIAQSKEIAKSWSCMAKFVTRLIEVDLLSCECFESQCIGIYQQEWDKITLKYLSNCFEEIINSTDRKCPNSKKFSSLLSFMSSYCYDMDF